ncbi:hypothetical protein SKAU_G00277740 [Synaphobranchus kaupii]|uniref:Uncharacterized protein n=1 Tax=Synaphobranchus kaupii TaxID=118154 RepID=A0A9Q1INP9_SYNKA|nr:hypothetical protein SKAU_G00277740 [Synaphobranchus kaupii]
MDARIQNLENSPSATRFSSNEPGIGASSAATYDANPAPSNLAIEPRRTMGTAIPAAPECPSSPPAAAISPHLRSQVLAVFAPTQPRIPWDELGAKPKALANSTPLPEPWTVVGNRGGRRSSRVPPSQGIKLINSKYRTAFPSRCTSLPKAKLPLGPGRAWIHSSAHS